MIDSVERAQGTSPGFRARLPRQTLHGLSGTSSSAAFDDRHAPEHRIFIRRGDLKVMRTLREVQQWGRRDMSAQIR